MSSHRFLSDNELFILLKRGDHAAYTQIYKRYWAVLFRHARKMLGNDEASDIVQEVFTALWIKAPELQITTSLSAYLYTSVRNKTIDLISHSRVRDNYLKSLENFIEQGESVTDNQVRFNEFALIIESEIEKLPPKMREIFELSRKANLSYNEIAVKMNIANNTVKKQMNRAIKVLRLKLGMF